jgi:hypothetical protein
MTENVLNVVWAAALVLMGLGAVLMKWFYRRLRTEHHEVWLSLGEPSLFLNASILVQQRVARFLWRSDYKELGDPTLNQIASVAKLLAVMTLVLIVAGFILTIRVL